MCEPPRERRKMWSDRLFRTIALHYLPIPLQ
jgi:hypothetical protein